MIQIGIIAIRVQSTSLTQNAHRFPTDLYLGIHSIIQEEKISRHEIGRKRFYAASGSQ